MHGNNFSIDYQRKHSVSADTRGGTQFVPPITQECQVERNRFDETFYRAGDLPLTYVSAPPGSGKTTLLSQWFYKGHFSGDGTVEHLWISLKKEEGCSTQLLQLIEHQLELSGLLTRPFPENADSTCAKDHLDWVNNHCKKPIVLFIDNFQYLASVSAIELIDYITQNENNLIHWVVASNKQNTIGVTKLSGNLQAQVIDIHDLAFKYEEMIRLYESRGNVEIDPLYFSFILQSTAGWAFAVNQCLTADTRFCQEEQLWGTVADPVSKIIEDNLVNYLSPKALELLLKIFRFSTFHKSKCSELMGESCSSSLLEELSYHFVLHPSPHNKDQYSINPLVTQYLSARVDAYGFNTADLMLETVTAEGATLDSPTEDVTPLAESEDWVADYVFYQAKQWLLCGDAEKALQWLSKIPHPALFTQPNTGLVYLAALIYGSQYEKADQFLEQFIQSLNEKQVEQMSPCSRRQLSVNLAALSLLLHIFQHDLNSISIETTNRLKLYIDIPGEHQGMLVNIYSFLLFMNGRYDKARFYACRAGTISSETNNPFSRSISTLLLCLCDRALGRFDLALESIKKAQLEFSTAENTPAWACLTLINAMFQYELNNVEQAETTLNNALPVLKLSAITEFNVHGVFTLCRIKSLNYKLQDAYNVLTYLESNLETDSLERWSPSIRHEQVRLALLDNKPKEALKYSVDTPADTALPPCSFARSRYCPAIGHVPSRTELMLALYERDYTKASIALGQLSQVCLLQQDSFLRIILLSSSAVIEFGNSNIEEAMEYINQSLRLAQQSGMFRALFDEVFGFGEVFQFAYQKEHIEDDISASLLNNLLKVRFCNAKQVITQATQHSAPLDPLTDTETRILKLLAEGHSNKEISSKSGIAITTTKWHLRNIYEKLAAKNRTEAVHKAQACKLISL